MTPKVIRFHAVVVLIFSVLFRFSLAMLCEKKPPKEGPGSLFTSRYTVKIISERLRLSPWSFGFKGTLVRGGK